MNNSDSMACEVNEVFGS